MMRIRDLLLNSAKIAWSCQKWSFRRRRRRFSNLLFWITSGIQV